MFVDNVLTIINLFFIPIISLYIYIKKNNKALRFSFENFCIYAVLVATSSILNKALVVVINLVSGKMIYIASSYYTLIGLVTAVFIPIIYEIITKYISVRVKEKKNDEE
ncbi:MAG: hypothetical protein IJW78_04225 [Clostridia bacterium]|nr:hypothetical protein [Clostridia bacterium]